MPTSSADPTDLVRLARGQRHLAEQLLIGLSPLDEAVTALWAVSDRRFVGPMPTIVGDLRRFATRLLTQADHVGQIAQAFELADGGPPHGQVTVPDAALAAAVMHTPRIDGLARDLRSLSPVAIAALLHELAPTTLDELIARHPALLGTTDGVPFAIRYRANHLRVAADLHDARARGDAGDVRRLEVLAHDQVALYDPALGRVAVVFGDLATARHVAVEVPGTGQAFANFTGDTRTYGQHLAAAMERHAPGATATVAWLGYDAPAKPESLVDDQAAAGAQHLADFTRGMGLASTQTLTLVGHSYGSLVVVKAEASGAGARNVVLLGSPGVELRSARHVGVPSGGGVYVERAPADPIGATEAYGPDPSKPSFGATRMTTNATGRPRVSGHSHYFTPGSEALENTAAVATGQRPQTQSPTVGERMVDAQRRVEPLVDPAGTALHEAAKHYNGPGHQALEYADRLDQGVHGVVNTAERNAIDGTVDLAKDAASLPGKAINALLP